MPDPVFGDRLDENDAGDYNRHQHGVFGLHPLSTPKYAKNEGLRDNECKETLARMYLSLAGVSDQAKQLYLRSLPGDARVQALARVLVGAGQKVQTGFIDFLLQQANETFTEVLQVDKVLGDHYVAFYFGQEPPVFQYTGALINSQQDDQRTGFALAYQHLLRGTQLARRGALLRLRYDSVLVSGTLNQCSQVLNAENELAVPFSFSMLVKEYVVLQPPQFQRKSAADYVQLETEFAPGQLLRGVGVAQDVRVRSTMVTPDQLAEESSAGQEERLQVGPSSASALESLSTKAAEEPLISADELNRRGLLEPTLPPATLPDVTRNIGNKI